MADADRLSEILDSAKRARELTSSWSTTKQEFARKSTLAVIAPFPAASDVGPKQKLTDKNLENNLNKPKEI